MSDLVGNPEDRFSHNEAHMLLVLTTELAALECLKINVPNFFWVAIYLILFKLASNKDMHNILDEFKFLLS